VFSHGLTKDEITTVPVIVRDEKTNARSYSERQFLSIHIHGSAAPGPKHDEAYDAFVKMYRDNSDIKSAYDVCLPNASMNGSAPPFGETIGAKTALVHSIIRGPTGCRDESAAALHPSISLHA
jgi:hypothetical protein